MVPGRSRPFCHLFALGLSLAGHGLLLQLPMPESHPVAEQPLAAEAANSAVTDIAVVSLPTPLEQPSQPEQPPPAAQSTPEPRQPEQLDLLPGHQPTSPHVAYKNKEGSTPTVAQPAAAAAVTSPPGESIPTDSNSAKPVQFNQFWEALSDHPLTAVSLTETLELFGPPHQAALFVDERGKARSHLETFVLLPDHSPTQAMDDLVQPQLIATATCDVSALTASPHQQAGGGAVYATECGPLRRYLNLLPLGGGGTLVVLWGEEP